MTFIRRTLYMLEYKRLNLELKELIGFFDNRSEEIAAWGEELEDIKNIDKLTKRFNKIYYRVEKLEKLLNL